MMNSTNKLSVPQFLTYIDQVDYLFIDSQPDPNESLDVVSPTSTVQNCTI